MNKELYKSSVDKIKFDEKLESRTLNYIYKSLDNQGDVRMNSNKDKWKLKLSASTAVAACTICVLSATAYAAVTNTKKIEHTKHGFTSKRNIEMKDESVTDSELVEILDTSKIRTRMEKDNSEIELISEETGDSTLNWIKKYTFKDSSKTYISDDTINWEVDKEDPDKIITEYIYKNYDIAIKDSGLPNIMENIFFKSFINNGALLEEYSTEYDYNNLEKRVVGEFNYRKGNISIDLSKYSKKDSEYAVITDTEKTTNQREYNSKSGIKYKLSDSSDNKTSTMISSGYYCLNIKFEKLSEDDIYDILEKLDLSGLDMNL